MDSKIGERLSGIVKKSNPHKLGEVDNGPKISLMTPLFNSIGRVGQYATKRILDIPIAKLRECVASYALPVPRHDHSFVRVHPRVCSIHSSFDCFEYNNKAKRC